MALLYGRLVVTLKKGGHKGGEGSEDTVPDNNKELTGITFADMPGTSL